MFSDLVDGYLARRFHAESFAGKIIDLISDKSLTIVSLLYAAERGVALLPLSIIGVREMIVLGARAIFFKGAQLLPTNRVFGGIMALLLWSNTLALVVYPDGHNIRGIANRIYWGCAIILGCNLVNRVYTSRRSIKAILTNGG